MNEPLRMWTLYAHPLDYPQGYVAREWVVLDGREQASHTAFYSETLDEMSAFFDEHYPHLIFMLRSPDDEPQIVGTWI